MILTPNFRLEVWRERASPAPFLRLETSGQLSVGATSDGMVTAVLLGCAERESDAEQVATKFGRDGTMPIGTAIGSVGCVIVDLASGQVSAWTPPISHRQIFWAAHRDRLGIASMPLEALSNRGITAGLRPEALFQYIYFHMVPSPTCIYDGVYKLGGGHSLSWTGDKPRLTRYWRPEFKDLATFSEPEAAEELRHLMREAVHRSVPSKYAVGAFLSGGLDSSTVAGLAAELRPGIPTVTMGFDAEGYDEMEYARIAARHFGTTPLEYYVTPADVMATLPKIATAFAEPFGNSSAAAAYHCARLAGEHGLDLLLAGDGGDELFGGNERYAKQIVFEHYARVPISLRTMLLEPCVAAAGRITQAFPIGKIVSYVDQAKVPLPDRLQTYNFLHRHAPEEVFSADLLSRVDTSEPLRQLREEYGTPVTTNAVNRMLFLDWKFTLQDNDLVKVSQMCQLGGIEVAYPMLDPHLVDFSLKLPGDWKVRNGELRWFYKRAMRSFLPRAILKKTKHGFGLPFGVWTRTHSGLRRQSEEALGSLGERGFFRPEFLRNALRMHREGHASYYGELVWILTVLEFWMRGNAASVPDR